MGLKYGWGMEERLAMRRAAMPSAITAARGGAGTRQEQELAGCAILTSCGAPAQSAPTPSAPPHWASFHLPPFTPSQIIPVVPFAPCRDPEVLTKNQSPVSCTVRHVPSVDSGPFASHHRRAILSTCPSGQCVNQNFLNPGDDQKRGKSRPMKIASNYC
jgi:hypothetical protein